jgi:thiamine biosynthesis lipoprotein
VTARRVEHVMGLPVTLALRGRHTTDDAADGAWCRVVDSLHEADRVFSTYRDDSEVSRINHGELSLDDASPIVREVLCLGDEAKRASGGAFDVWRTDDSGFVSLDPSGIVKGWAVDRAATRLHDLDDTDFCLSAGGDMVCRTVVPGAEPWRIGLEDPHEPQRLLGVVPLANGAVATSGTAHRGQHLVDARTGLAPDGVASVTVITASLTWADIDATAAYAHGTDAARWLETRPDRTALVVWPDGTTTTVRTAPAARAA